MLAALNKRAEETNARITACVSSFAALPGCA